MRIAVISDTHDNLPANVCQQIQEADEIWHLGDICSPSVLFSLELIGPPLRFVRGNCDYEETWPGKLDFQMEGFRIHLEHVPNSKSHACDLFLHGHTHVPRNEILKGVRFLNPGCITRPNRGAPASFAWLTLENGTMHWEIVLV